MTHSKNQIYLVYLILEKHLLKLYLICTKIEISFDAFATIADRQRVKISVNEMKRVNMINCGLDDVEEFDVSKLSEKWTGDLRWYNKYNIATNNLEEFVCVNKLKLTVSQANMQKVFSTCCSKHVWTPDTFKCF